MTMLKCEAIAAYKATDRRERFRSSVRAQCSRPGRGSTTGDDPDCPLELNALGKEVDRPLGTMHDHPLILVSHPQLSVESRINR